MQKKEIETFYPTSQHEWRTWLQENHVSKQAVWLVYYRIKSGVPTISWSDAVDEALCFGWIDSTKKSIDDERFMQFFCKRKPTSVWSKINKSKVERLIQEEKFTKAGFNSVEVAKQNGSWLILNEVEELNIPIDLEKAFKTQKGAKQFFLSLSKSTKKSILQWLILAKRGKTRQNRCIEIAELAAKNLKPKQF
ncbi:MAG: YdeI/OmpD-associated family protein [Bacteroidota bacterium]